MAWSIGIGAASVACLLVTGTLTPETSIVSLPVSLVSLLVLEWIAYPRRK